MLTSLRRARRWLLVVMTLATAAALTGCAPADRNGLTVDDAGLVSVENCGTWITAVRMLDSDSGAVVWSVEATQRSDGAYVGTAGKVELGQAPPGWIENGRAPSPGEPLRLVVESVNNSPLEMNPPTLEPSDVYYDGRRRSGGFSDYCDPLYPISTWLYPTAVIGALAALGVGVIVLLGRRTVKARVRQAPPPPT